MSSEVRIASRVHKRHPELEDEDVFSAWKNAFVFIERTNAEMHESLLVAVGFDKRNRMIEMVAVIEENGTVFIFHAMTPPSKKTLHEAGILR